MPMNVSGELTTPSSQFWHLEAMQSLLCDRLGCFDIFHSSFSSPHVTLGHHLALIPHEILGSCISRVCTPLDFKNLDARNRKNDPSGSMVEFSLNLMARINCSNNISHSLLNMRFPFFYGSAPI